MNLWTIFITALNSLARHKFRSLLTTLGIIIGTIAIIFVMSIGQGAKIKINAEIKQLGTNFMLVLSASQKRLSDRTRSNKPTLTPRDLKTIKTQCDDIALISPGRQLTTKLSIRGKSRDTIIGGVSSNYLDVRDWPMVIGDFFTRQNERSKDKVCIIGQTVVDELYDGELPVGQTLRIKGVPFEIIGVLAPKGKRPDGNDQDDIVLMPITTMNKRLIGGKAKYFAFLMSARSKDRLKFAAQEVRSILRQTHNIQPGEEDDFTLFTQDDIAQASDAASMILNLLLLFIASISLIVGGIGIMNIMLVTVTERTQEIGVRMALGATTSNILNQFILEAIVICLVGGCSGIFIGVILSKFVGTLLGWPVAISQTSVILSLVSSVGIGSFFGYYPALQASRLNPVEALAER